MTLTQAAIITKRGIIIFFALVFLGIAGKVGYGIWYSHYLSTLPPVEEKPEMKFGSLPSAVFPKAEVTSSNYSYSIDTTTGNLPQTPKLMKIYFLPVSGISLLSSDKSKKLAASLGFSIGPDKISQTLYKYTDDSNGYLTIDLSNGNFHLQRQTATAKSDLASAKSDLATASAQIENSQFDSSALQKNFKDYLSGKDLLPKDLDNGKINVIYSNNNKEDSNFAEVNLWPSEVDKIPIITAIFNKSLVRAIVNKSTDKVNRYTKIDYTYWPVDITTSSTYPIITAEQALNDLRSGKGYISIEPKNAQVSITSVYLAYYQTEEYTPYLQPIFIFEGPHFVALVPAIKTTR